MRRLFAALGRYRPRVLTLFVLACIAAMIVLANLSEDCRPRKTAPGPYSPGNVNLDFDVRAPSEDWRQGSFTWNMSYGWPLLWGQYVLSVGYGAAVIGANYSAARLTGNLAIWLVMLAGPTAACEWLLRRYRPRLRFSLRTMLAAMGLAAALCAWFAAARNRANVQDPLIAAINARSGRVWVERRGPKWLDSVGADRYRRRIVGAELNVSGSDEKDDQKGQRLLADLGRLPSLQYLFLEADHLTPAMTELRQLRTLRIAIRHLSDDSGHALAGALSGMRRLQTLSISPASFGIGDADEGMPRECLAAIGAMNQLEYLRLEGRTTASENLACLAGLTNLKSLALESIFRKSDQPNSDPPLLSRLPALPSLEALDLQYSEVRDPDLQYVAALPRLKSLNLNYTMVSGLGLAELASLGSLEELAIDRYAVSAAGFESLLKLKRLTSLHIESFPDKSLQSADAIADWLSPLPEDEFDRCLQMLRALQNSKPNLVIEGDLDALDWPEERMVPFKYETIPEESMGAAARQAVGVWKQQQAGK